MDGVYGRKIWHGLGNQNYWDTYYMQGHAFMIHNFENGEVEGDVYVISSPSREIEETGGGRTSLRI
jgi:hypothetical protein